MGNCQANVIEDERKFKYNEYESKTTNLSGPFVHPSVSNFQDIEKDFAEKSLIKEIVNQMENNLDKQCLGHRKQIMENGHYEKDFTFYNNKEILQMSEHLSQNLIQNNLLCMKEFEEEGKFTFLGIFARNCVEWIITDLACQLNSVTSVTFYSTLGDQAFEHICTQTEISTICISPENIDIIIQYKSKYGLEHLKKIIVYDLNCRIVVDKLEALKKVLTVHMFSDLIKISSISKKDLQLSSPSTVLTICYTSGTTALPKGVQLTQKNFYAQLTSSIIASGFIPKPDDVHFSYLPLAHVMERVLILYCLTYGVKAGMITGDVKKYLQDDIQLLKPTLLIAVPRVLNTLRQVIYLEFEKISGCRKSMLNKAIRIKMENLQNKGLIHHEFYDKLIFKKLREKFGGRIRMMITGSAPLPKDLADDIKILFSCPIVEAYGMTECCGAAVVTHQSEMSNSSAGGVFPACRIKLNDVPEMNYDSNSKLDGRESPSGEICIGGPVVFKGYFRNPEETKKILKRDSEGCIWLHSGDVGRILPKTSGLKIFDRIKEIFKLSQGEYIAPSKLESVYGKSRYVQQIWVYGDSMKSFVVSIIVPNKILVCGFLKTKKHIHVEPENVEKYFDDKELLAEIKNEFDKLAKENSFNSLEKINKFILSGKEFTIDNGCLTPTMKLVRRKIEATYKEEITKMYDS